MADFEPPSFSLGLDDHQEEETIVHRDETVAPSFDLLREDEGEEEEDPRPIVLKRLKRGPSSPPRPRPCFDDDPASKLLYDEIDEIEEFSSPEDRREAQKHSICSGSKLSLRSQSVLTSQSTDGSSVKRSLAGLSFSFPESEASTTKRVLPPKITSPLRRIELLDSDSDEPSIREDTHEIYHGVDARTGKERAKSSRMHMGFQEKHIGNEPSDGSETLWKDVNERKYASLATPALDEFCQEYFGSVKSKGVARRKNDKGGAVGSSISNQLEDTEVYCFQETENHGKAKHLGSFGDDIPPSYYYFHHNDPRIQKLVAERLPNFRPLGYENCGVNELAGERTIDYMSQFGQKGAQQKLVQAHKSSNKLSQESTPRDTENSRARVNPKRSISVPRGAGKRKAKEDSRATTAWVNPKSSSSVPKDAGKRRVQAVVNSAGHWYTGQDGRKVYVSQTGEELTGRMAYRSYRKESGRGFKRKKKPTTGKKCK